MLDAYSQSGVSVSAWCTASGLLPYLANSAWRGRHWCVGWWVSMWGSKPDN